MVLPSPNEQIDAFIDAGNTFIGPRPVKFIGTFHLTWGSSNAVLELGEDITMSMARIAFVGRGGMMKIGNGATIKGRLEVNGGGAIRIGAGTFLNRICDIRGGEGATVDIGENCLFSNVKIMTSDMHSILDSSTSKRTNPAASIVIENEVWLSEDVKITKGVRVGFGSVIAAGSIVTQSIAPLCLAAGRPAKVLRTGVRWTRNLKRMDPLPAPKFKPTDIPMEKEVIRYLVACREYNLVQQVISAAGDVEELPLFARWYLVFTLQKIGRPHANARAILDQIISEAPNHAAARKLRDTIGQ